MNLLDAMNWRYAVKAFDPEKQVADEKIEHLLKVAHLAPTSMGQQPFVILWVKNPEVRKQLVPHSYGQEKVATSSHLLVFCAKTNLNDASVEAFMQHAASVSGQPITAYDGFSAMVKGFLGMMTEEMKLGWASRQAYLAMGSLLTAAAIEQIDSCPMEGFVASAYDEVLGLKEKNLTAICAISLGHRSADDATQHYPKIRLPYETIIQTV